MTTEGRLLRGMVLLVVGIGFLAPIAAGVWQTARAALGVLPAIGATEPGLQAFALLAEVPGIGRAIWLSMVTGLGSTLLSLLIAGGVVILASDRLAGRCGARLLAPFLAAPHAAMAIGLAFLLAPSGWIARGLAPVMGWDRPPDLATMNDPLGLALMLGLMVKEVPFLLLVMLSALTQVPLRRDLAIGRSLGYGRGMVWVKVVLPQIWPLIRLPLMVVLAYALSVVDMALILGPSNPPTLAVLLVRLFSDPDLARLLPASAGAMLQLGLVVASFAALWGGEHLLRGLGLIWLRRGRRQGVADLLAPRAAGLVALLLMGLGAGAMLSLLVWSLAWRWPWPEIWPDSGSLQAWARPGAGWGRALWNTALLAFATTGLSLMLAIAWLEAEDRARMARARWAEALIYLPLLVPQVSFLFGMNVLLLRLGLSGGMAAVIWGQCLFVFPYVMIALSDPWRARDRRLDRAAAALGAGPWRRLVAVKLPVLLAPICTAAAIGMAVSVAQYLPTLFLGAGRIATLTTEAVTLSSSSDRRVVGVLASLQAVLPWLAYLAAFLLPALLHRNRRDLRPAHDA